MEEADASLRILMRGMRGALRAIASANRDRWPHQLSAGPRSGAATDLDFLRRQQRLSRRAESNWRRLRRRLY